MLTPWCIATSLFRLVVTGGAQNCYSLAGTGAMSYRFERDFSERRSGFLSNSCLNLLSLAVLRREATSLKASTDERRQQPFSASKTDAVLLYMAARFRLDL
jgi:hypothetical protein